MGIMDIYFIVLGVSVFIAFGFIYQTYKGAGEIQRLEDIIELNRSAYGETEYLKDQIKEMQARINYLLDTFGLEEDIEKSINNIPNYVTRVEHHYYRNKQEYQKKG